MDASHPRSTKCHIEVVPSSPDLRSHSAYPIRLCGVNILSSQPLSRDYLPHPVERNEENVFFFFTKSLYLILRSSRKEWGIDQSQTPTCTEGATTQLKWAVTISFLEHETRTTPNPDCHFRSRGRHVLVVGSTSDSLLSSTESRHRR